MSHSPVFFLLYQRLHMSTAVSNRFQNKRSLIPNKKNSYYPVSWLINKLSFTCLLVLIPWIPLVILHQFNPRLLKSQVKVDELQVETINRLVNWKCQFIVRLEWNWILNFQPGCLLVVVVVVAVVDNLVVVVVVVVVVNGW